VEQRDRGYSYVWYHHNGDIAGVGTILPEAPPQLRLAPAPDDPHRLSLIEVESIQGHDPTKVMHEIQVIAGRLQDRGRNLPKGV
jgi:hypothetical protein